MTSVSSRFHIDRLSCSDLFECSLSQDCVWTKLELNTLPENGKEKHIMRVTSNCPVDVRKLGQIILLLKPDYPGCPIDQIDRVYDVSLRYLYTGSPTDLNRTGAERFVFAYRMWLIYKRIFFDQMREDLRLMQLEYKMLPSIYDRIVQDCAEGILGAPKNFWVSESLSGYIKGILSKLRCYNKAIPQPILSSSNVQLVFNQLGLIKRHILELKPIESLCAEFLEALGSQ